MVFDCVNSPICFNPVLSMTISIIILVNNFPIFLIISDYNLETKITNC